MNHHRRAVSRLALVTIIALIIGAGIGYIATSAMTTTSTSTAKFAVAPAAGTKVTITMGFDPAFPPWTEVMSNGSSQGFDIDVMQWVANYNNWTLVENHGNGAQ